jgi:hypothetical protein
MAGYAIVKKIVANLEKTIFSVTLKTIFWVALFSDDGCRFPDD